MSADREALLKVQAELEHCIDELGQCHAPAGIAEHVRLAIERLSSHIAMLDNWDSGSAWDR